MDFSSDQAQRASTCFAETELTVRVADARFVLDTLERLDRCDPAGLFTGRLDTSRAAIFGYSFGGAVAAEACRVDERFRACIDYDGSLFGGAAREGVERPFLVMGDDNPVPAPDPAARRVTAKDRQLAFVRQSDRDVLRSFLRYGGYSLSIKGVSHINFCDKPLFLPFRRISDAGPIDPHRAVNMIRACTHAFFDECLGARAQPQLPETARQYPEVRLTIYHPPNQDSKARAPLQPEDSFANAR
jgi:dienelactone hydrolase